MPFPALATIPDASDRRIAVRVTKDALRHVKAGHPWVFDGAVESIKPEGQAGDLAVIFDDKRRFAAIGLYDPASPLRVRILQAGTPVTVDESFWLDRLASAIDLRRSLVDDPETTAYRCVNGENDGLPGLIVDRYDDTAVVKLYTAAWFPHLDAILDPLVGLLEVDRVVLRLARSVQAGETHGLHDAMTLHGTPPDAPVVFLERGLRFEADVLAGQKTGHFLDQRENRVLVGGLSDGAAVLDVFSCTGGFSVHAGAGGAHTVTSVDQSEPALATARRNWERNRDQAAIATATHTTVAGDAFDVMADLAFHRRRFDVVVIDPPSFASSAAQVDRALRSYRRLSVLGLGLVADGGMLVQSSCSSRIDEHQFLDTVHAGAAEAGVRLEEWARTGHAVDHPVSFPEGRYLKTLFAQVGR